MRLLKILVAAAAARAEYFDVEEDAFWENDGPQEPRRDCATMKPAPPHSTGRMTAQMELLPSSLRERRRPLCDRTER